MADSFHPGILYSLVLFNRRISLCNDVAPCVMERYNVFTSMRCGLSTVGGPWGGGDGARTGGKGAEGRVLCGPGMRWSLIVPQAA